MQRLKLLEQEGCHPISFLDTTVAQGCLVGDFKPLQVGNAEEQGIWDTVLVGVKGSIENGEKVEERIA